MKQAVVIIPNYNGLAFLHGVLESLRRQEFSDFSVLMVDNGSDDGSADYVNEKYPEVRVVRLDHNTGFSGGINAGIRSSEEPYIILLNNDTVCGRHFVGELVEAMERDPEVFSACAMMRQMKNHDLIDDSGDYYCALGWAFTEGRDRDRHKFQVPKDIFASCAGAAIYRRSMLRETGLFDEKHFAYLEDIDIGWRARLLGYRNVYVPQAQVLHYGSGSSGSRYNSFKVKLSARNSLYLIGKNMPAWQIFLNLPLLAAGFTVKTLYFRAMGFGKEYVEGLREGFRLCRESRSVGKRFRGKNPGCYLGIQLELWVNTVRRLCM